MSRIEQWVQERLRWEDWESLRKVATATAAKEIRRRKWRGARGGVLPEGIEAEDVADQAIVEMLSGKTRLVLGWIRPRLEKELKRLVRQRVRRLHARKETQGVRSEWEFLGSDENGELVSVLELLPDRGTDENGLEAERAEVRKQMKQELEQFIAGEGDEAELNAVLECLWAGITKREEIAQRVGVEQKEVVRLKKKLRRRLAHFIDGARRNGGSRPRVKMG